MTYLQRAGPGAAGAPIANRSMLAASGCDAQEWVAVHTATLRVARIAL
jgi:hypothetical protein